MLPVRTPNKSEFCTDKTLCDIRTEPFTDANELLGRIRAHGWTGPEEPGAPSPSTLGNAEDVD